jgi:hypothetical protein
MRPQPAKNAMAQRNYNPETKTLFFFICPLSPGALTFPAFCKDEIRLKIDYDIGADKKWGGLCISLKKSMYLNEHQLQIAGKN